MAVPKKITKRPGTKSDREFLYALLKDSLGEYVEATFGPWDESWQRKNFLETTDPGAHEIVESDGVPIGCLLVEDCGEFIALHRICIRPEHQNLGIGAGLVREVLEVAASARKPVRLRVFTVNPARRFYDRLGFRKVDQTTTHVIMEYAA